MGLSACVACNCYREGKTKPFTIPELEQYYIIDGEFGCRLHLPYKKTDEIRDIMWKWEEDACEHKYMLYANEWIANWTGYRHFQHALEYNGWEHFPTLKAEQRQGNGGFTYSNASAHILEELDYFRTHLTGQLIQLTDPETGAKGHRSVCGIRFDWAERNGLAIGLDINGFFIQTDEEHGNEDVFRAWHFEQRIIERYENGNPRTAEFTNIDTGERFAPAIPVDVSKRDEENKKWIDIYPKLLHVENRPITADDFTYILKPLEIVCKASVETGNAIIWG